MALKNYAHYNTTTGLIDNILLIDDSVEPTLTWPEGYSVIVLPDEGVSGSWSMCSPGWSYIDGQFVEPEPPPAPEQPKATGAQTL
jgi:hypothetical protein